MKRFKTFEDVKHNIPEGATHYRDEDDKNLFTWVKVGGGSVEIWCDAFCQWKPAGAHVNLIMRKITPIKNQPKRTRTEYEKVAESIWELRVPFERGELWCKHEFASDYSKVINTQTLAQSLHGGYCFRKVEKEIDWKKEVKDFCGDKYSYLHINDDGHVNCLLSYDSDIDFLELCRVALRANGEID